MNNKTISGMKCILYLFGLLALPVQAASFDCAKAGTKIEKLICGDAELSKLDEELNAAYKAAVQDKTKAKAVKQAQKQWMKERNGCEDAACVKGAYEARLSLLAGTYTSTGESVAAKQNVTPAISKLDDELGKVYHDVLSKANEEHKQRLMAEQKHWLEHTRNACSNETCFKHAYWSRLAALAAYFEPHSPLYKKESDKAEAIKQVLATAPLYLLGGAPKATPIVPNFCTQIFDDLKQMKDIRFVDPVVQTQSYEDPALDPWKKQCKSAPPFNFSYQCLRNIESADADDDVDACDVSYGLPPFRLYELPPVKASGEKRYIFYADDAYGPMNRDWQKPALGGRFSSFTQINITKCLSARGNIWERGQKIISAWGKTSVAANAGQGDRNGKNYNSIIEYKNQYYFLVLHEIRNNYWLDIEPTVRSSTVCNWTPVKQ